MQCNLASAGLTFRVSAAPDRLEVGQVGVLKFGGGEGVVPLQPLDAPFGDSVGPSLAARLTFRQVRGSGALNQKPAAVSAPCSLPCTAHCRTRRPP